MHFGEMNPWFSMWTQPRETIRSIIQHNPRYGVFCLATIYALQNLFYFANFYSVGLDFRLFLILAIILILSPAIGMLWVYYTGWILQITGRWLGGGAPTLHLRAVVAWSQVPCILSLVMWFVLALARSEMVFVQAAIGSALIFVNLIALILGIWSFVLLVQSIREIQGFSLGRSLANVFLSGGISWVVVFLLVLSLGVVISSL